MATSGDFAFVNQGKADGQSAIGRLIQGGSWDPGITNRDLRGVGGQRLIRKGTQQTMITGLQVFSPDLTLMALFLRTELGVQVAAFPDFTAGVDAGDGNEIEVWTLEDCQPASIKLACPDEGEMVATLDIWAATPSLSNTTSVNNGQVAATTIGHTNNETDVQLGAADYEFVDWEFAVNNNPSWHNPQGAKEAGAKTLPSGVILGNEEATARLVHTLPIPKTVIDLSGDDWNDAEDARNHLELIITADNGIAAEDAIFTLSSLLPDGSPRSVQNDSGRWAIETSLISETATAAAAIT